MKSTKQTLLIVIAALAFTFTSCIKTDDYIDWKVMNDEWFTANLESKESYPFEWTIDVLKTPVIQDEFKITESGVKYKRLRKGNPTEKKPNLSSYIYATYEGKLIDGTKFDSGTEKYLGQTYGFVSGFQEIILKMTIGDIYEIYIPYTCGYGKEKAYKVPPYSTLIFRIELTDVLQ
ncbi:MAG TPA: hypothetical protein GXZ87_00695 [Bacteroidales bacterium]|nr:hypothetical protein [Bacteroidales bacterium]